jgi:sialic acid synthase SpsE
MYIDEIAKEKFSNKVIERVKKTQMTFMDSVLELTEEMGLDPTASGKLLTKPIIEKIQQEAKELHLLKGKIKKLPLD